MSIERMGSDGCIEVTLMAAMWSDWIARMVPSQEALLTFHQMASSSLLESRIKGAHENLVGGSM